MGEQAPTIRFSGNAAWNLDNHSKRILQHKCSYPGTRLKLILGSHRNDYVNPSKKKASLFVKVTKRVRFEKIKLISVPFNTSFLGVMKNCHPTAFTFDRVSIPPEADSVVLARKFINSRKRLAQLTVRNYLDEDSAKLLALVLQDFQGFFTWHGIERFRFSFGSKLIYRDNLVRLSLCFMSFINEREERLFFRTLSHSVTLKRLYLEKIKLDWAFKVPFSLMAVYSDMRFESSALEEVQTLFRVDLPPNLAFLGVNAKVPDAFLLSLLRALLRTAFYDKTLFRSRSGRLQNLLNYLDHEFDKETGPFSIVQRAMQLVKLSQAKAKSLENEEREEND